MDTIAALESFVSKLIKFHRVTREAGLPEEVYQKAIDDLEFRAWFVKTCQDKLERIAIFACYN